MSAAGGPGIGMHSTFAQPEPRAGEPYRPQLQCAPVAPGAPRGGPPPLGVRGAGAGLGLRLEVVAGLADATVVALMVSTAGREVDDVVVDGARPGAACRGAGRAAGAGADRVALEHLVADLATRPGRARPGRRGPRLRCVRRTRVDVVSVGVGAAAGSAWDQTAPSSCGCGGRLDE
jgi:hypothetical protein